MKRILLLTALMIAVLVPSCKKSDSAANSNNDSNNNSQEELYAWFIDNGWHEAIIQYNNPCTEGHFFMGMDISGNIVGEQFTGYTGGYTDYQHRLYSSFDKVKKLTSAPSDGYTTQFVCEDNRCGITREEEYYSGGGKRYYYSKFYVERINSSKAKVYFKEWYSISE